MAESEVAAKPQKPQKPKKVAPTAHTLREYETIYLLRQDLTPDQVDRIKERMRGVIDREGGRVIRFTTWGRKKTAFPVGDKELRAIYVHLAYLAKGGLVAELERNLRNLEEVLKFQTIKVSEAVDPETRPTEEDVVLEGDREEERSAREGEEREEERPRREGEKAEEAKPATSEEPKAEEPQAAQAEAAKAPQAEAADAGKEEEKSDEASKEEASE